MAKSEDFKKQGKVKTEVKFKNFKTMDYYNELNEKDRQFAETFSEYVNGEMVSPRKTGKELANDHRYLVNEKARLMFYFMEQLAENWHKGRYDRRNEWACRLAAEAIDHLAEQNLYHPSEEYFENQRQ